MADNGRAITRRWHCAAVDHERKQTLAREVGISPVIAGLLLARGIASAEEARRFLQPELEHVHDPFLLPDMEAAVTRLAAAVRDGDRILVHGDYDVDGVTAAALLTRVLRKLGGNVEHFVPHRREDGYDLQVGTVRRKAAEGIKLIVTADCGIVALDAAECARDLGVELIVTDHHEPGPELPVAVAVVNPKRHDATYPFPHLAGVGVAFKLATALVRRMGLPEHSFRTHYLDLVGLGTAADCMPLVGENRVFVKYGLETLQQTKKAGLRALIQSAGLGNAKLSARTLGFVLGPRINAVGRLDAAAHALELMLTSDPAEAYRLAELLERCNQDRQAAQSRIFDEALDQARACVEARHPVLVLAAPGWHSGIIGIVASKMVEAFSRPTIMIALEDDGGRGSARSVAGFNIFHAISSCQELLERCGGHEAAAGFEIKAARVEEFRGMLCRVAAEQMDAEALIPRLELDDYLDPCDLELRLARELACMEPFGHGNPSPVFATRALRVAQLQTMESRRIPNVSHLKLHLCANGGAPVEAVYWNNGHKADEITRDTPLDVCYALEVNDYRGTQSLQLVVKDLRIAEEGA